MPKGLCKFCGCTEALACAGGCAWADPEQTICTACLPHVPGEELALLVAAEFQGVEDVVQIEMFAPAALMIVAQLQLAARHPHNDHRPDTVLEFAAFLIQFIAEGRPAAAELVRRGDEPEYAEDDVHLEPGEMVSPGGIIIP